MRKSGVASLSFGGVFAAVGAQAAQEIVRGVNLGGWLVTEPWMTPSLFNSTSTADEWHLCNVLGKDKCLSTLQDHWSTFYTRDDLVDIKNAGLNAIRIPLGYWAVDLLDYEPYVSGQYPYLIQAVQWADQLGLKVMVDIHGAPGSQNGWEETGLVGPVDFPANATNANRTLNVLQNLTSEFSKDIYGGAVTNIELLNEPLLGFDVLTAFYTDGYNIVNKAHASGINTTIHDGFLDPHTWENYDPNDNAAQTPAPFLAIDTHQFWGFPPLDNLTAPEILEHICTFGQQQLKQLNTTMYNGIPPTLVGEWSLNSGVTANTTTNTEQDVDKRTWFRQLFEAQNAAYTPNAPGQPSIGWYFWSWKTEYDIDAWSYRKGIADEYIPKNVSDPSTYIFPIKDNGCIDASFDYTAPAKVGGGASATSSSSGSSGSSTGGSGSKSGSDKKSAATTSFGEGYGVAAWVAIAATTAMFGFFA